MAKIPTSNYANNQTFTCSVPAIVEPLDDEYPFKVLLKAKEHGTYTHDADGSPVELQDFTIDALALFESKFPIFVTKKSIADATRALTYCKPIQNYNLVFSPITAEQYYVATFSTMTYEDTKSTLLLGGKHVYENYQGAWGSVTTQGLIKASDRTDRRFGFYKNLDGEYLRIPYNGELPEVASINLSQISAGESHPQQLQPAVLFAGNASESSSSSVTNYFMDRYFAGDYYRPPQDAPRSAPTASVYPYSGGYGLGAITFMDYSGTAYYEQTLREVLHTYECTLDVTSSMKNIDNIEFNDIITWWEYCSNMI